MPTSLKTLTKPQRDLLTAVSDGLVYRRTNTGSGARFGRYLSEDRYESKSVNEKTWDALEDQGLAELGPMPARWGSRQPTLITDTGKRILAGETVNTARSLAFTFRLGDATVTRQVPLPPHWHRYPGQREHDVKAAREALLAELVAVEWVESDEAVTP